MIMFLTGCLQIKRSFSFSWETEKVDHTWRSISKKAIEQFFIWHQYLYFLVSPFLRQSDYTPSPLPSPPRFFSFCKQVQTLFKETDSCVIKPKLNLILKILAIENVDHLQCTVCIPGVSWIILIKRLSWILEKNFMSLQSKFVFVAAVD